jgi:hypothetical protein
MISDRFFYPLAALAAALLIGLALVWPQGQGAKSSPPHANTPAPRSAAR